MAYNMARLYMGNAAWLRNKCERINKPALPQLGRNSGRKCNTHSPNQ
jgi:hypothetical protein